MKDIQEKGRLNTAMNRETETITYIENRITSLENNIDEIFNFVHDHYDQMSTTQKITRAAEISDLYIAYTFKEEQLNLVLRIAEGK